MTTFTLTLKLFFYSAYQYAGPILYYSKVYRMDPLLVAAVIHKESKFRSWVCFRGAHGLMQIQLKNKSCRHQARQDASWLYKPRHNIKRGIKLLRMWKRYCKRVHPNAKHHWLQHYNSGIYVIKRGKAAGYADRVLTIYHKLKRIKARILAQQR